MTAHRRNVWQTPLCPAGCFGKACQEGRHERIYGLSPQAQQMLMEFEGVVWHLRDSKNEPPLVFMQFTGIALMVNSEQHPAPGRFEDCKECGAGTEGCECEPNILAILAKEGGSEWQS